MSSFERYYEEEMRYLREAGKDFSESFPERARLLNLDAVEHRDPYVERLFEGFSFLTGRIRQKLDDDFPELTHALFEMLAPEFLRPVPSCAMLEFKHRAGMLTGSHLLPRGTEVMSSPVGTDWVTCKFQTTSDVWLHPIRLIKAEYLRHPRKGDGISLDFQCDPGTTLSETKLNELPVYLHGDRSLAFHLFWLLSSQVREVQIEVDEKPIVSGSQDMITCGGLDENEFLLPLPGSTFPGSRQILEYLSFPEKFRMIRIGNLKPLTEIADAESFKINIYFSAPVGNEHRFQASNFRPFVSPVVNIFNSNSHPIRMTGRHFEFPLRPDGWVGDEVYHVESLMGIDKVSGVRRQYLPFHEFRHIASGKGGNGLFFRLRQERTGRDKRLNSFISIGADGNVPVYAEEYLSSTIWCTNGNLPATLSVDSINSPNGDFPSFCTFTNLTRPTTPIYPPDDKHHLWSLLSHFGMNFRSICAPGVLKEILSLYDWSKKAVNRKFLSGLGNARAIKKDYLMGTQLVRGTQIEIELAESAFAEAGEREMFAQVISQLLSQFTTINHPVSLSMVMTPSGERREWEPREGICPAI